MDKLKRSFYLTEEKTEKAFCSLHILYRLDHSKGTKFHLGNSLYCLSLFIGRLFMDVQSVCAQLYNLEV